MTPIYERTMFGTFLMIFMAVVAVFLFVTITMAEEADRTLWVVPVPFVAALLFGVMKVTVDRKELRIRFLLGVPRRTVPIEDIEACTVTRSKLETGFGMSVKPAQGKYCISGPSAVSILLRNGRSVLVGCPEPEQLLKAIEKARTRAGTREA